MDNLLHITKAAKDGKLQGIDSLNTSTLTNNYCAKMRNTDSVCSSCYSARYSKIRPSLENKLIDNSLLLSQGFIPENQLPFINASFFRINSFGELINAVHLHNILNLVGKNKHCTFTLWTKRKNIVFNVLAGRDKPSNLILIYSNPLLDSDKTIKPPKYFNKVFSVYSKKYSKNNNVDINCSGKKCITCMTCYTHNNIKQVREVKK